MFNEKEQKYLLNLKKEYKQITVGKQILFFVTTVGGIILLLLMSLKFSDVVDKRISKFIYDSVTLWGGYVLFLIVQQRRLSDLFLTESIIRKLQKRIKELET